MIAIPNDDRNFSTIVRKDVVVAIAVAALQAAARTDHAIDKRSELEKRLEAIRLKAEVLKPQ